ncbi:MAG: DUF5996 family protein [Burkholderiales bacterium]|nr:DUF5996 family protein [Burkholderiaceae bacterium]MCU0974452.1 DUF5996 family protein [Burkholderiales bacterium]
MLYATERGLTTTPMPWDESTLTVDLDFVAHTLTLRTSELEPQCLVPGCSGAPVQRSPRHIA